MRVLNVVLPESPHSIGHLNALASAGWEVHAVPSYPAPFLDGLDPAIVVHQRTLPPAPKPRHGREEPSILPVVAGRVRLAASRTLLAADQRMQGLGADLGLVRVLPPRTRTAGAVPGGSGGPLVAVAPGADGQPLEVLPHASESAGWLAELIDTLRPDIVHSGPLVQCAPTAYLARAACRRPFPVWLISNWGIDLHFSARDPSWRRTSEAILEAADCYFAECWRDVELARQYGFAGTVVGVEPIGGGVDVAGVRRLAVPGPTSARRAIMVKGYQNLIGRALVVLEAVRRCASLLDGYEVVIYGANEDVRLAAALLHEDTGLAVTAHAAGSRSYEDVLRDHGRARISIGSSLTDGLSTWALEALVMGSLPIQSSTSCLDEWVTDGVTGLLVHPEQPDQVAAALGRAIQDDDLVDRAAATNLATASERFDRSAVVPRIVAMYERAARAREARPTVVRPSHASRPSPGTDGSVSSVAAVRGVVVNTMPKSGTHMLVPAVQAALLLDDRWVDLYEGSGAVLGRHRAVITALPAPVLVRGHIYHSPEWAALRQELGLRMVFLYRDPRDIVVSYVHWLMGPERAVGAIQSYIRDELSDHQARLRAIITGFTFRGYVQPDIATFVSLFTPWIDEPGVEVVRFEDLAAPGSRRSTAARVCEYVRDARAGSDCGDRAVARMIAAMDPRGSATYRTGRSGDWRTEFDTGTSARFDEVAGDLVTRLGYSRATSGVRA